MNTLTRELPLTVLEPNPSETSSEGSVLLSSYFEFHISAPRALLPLAEISEEDILRAAEQSGTFQFLDSEEADGYNDLLQKPE